jgi:hypothetical protein
MTISEDGSPDFSSDTDQSGRVSFFYLTDTRSHALIHSQIPKIKGNTRYDFTKIKAGTWIGLNFLSWFAISASHAGRRTQICVPTIFYLEIF